MATFYLNFSGLVRPSAGSNMPLNVMYDTYKTGLLNTYALAFDDDNNVFNWADLVFETLSCPLTSDYTVAVAEDGCRKGYYAATADFAYTGFVTWAIYIQAGADPNPSVDQKLASKRNYYNGGEEVSDDYWQKIYDALINGINQIENLINTSGSGGTGSTSNDDRLNKIYSIVQNVQSIVSRYRK